MLEWLAATASVELGKLVLEQVLNLGKSALEDYVKDFFKDCIKGGIARANAETLKKPMAEAIGCFIKRFVKELQINDVPETSIEHHYKTAIKRFVQDKSVRPILGKAFETHCKQIDYVQLQQIWTQHYQESGWQFPAEEFDWRGVAKEYAFEVKGIIKANTELRSLLKAELLETIAQNTANLNTQISPGFDVAKYRESLQCSYGYLKLYTLDSTARTDAIRLWNIFIEQTVREALPPMRYELPLDLKRQLQEQGQLEADLSSETLEGYRQEYFQQPARKVLEAVAESQRAVVLGDPGAGKSTLLQYLTLEWVEGETDALPLLIELREYALAQTNNFLEFLHRGRGVDWQFDQQQLHQYLQDNPALVMFDGLDEVFDRATQAVIVDDMIRFAQQYPKAQILVTSRIIGYNPDRLQQAGFRHFTIQSLNIDEIHEFIDRWYALALGNDADKSRLVTRLKDAIANSKAIQNLADNPLLLTMMAILNRRQELPRDRADLYDQASRVLLYHWDVDHKRLQLPIDAIGRREKQEILRAIAYEMQACERGLKGNLIGAERLIQIISDYLRWQGFSQPREKANLLIQQLRERNSILCYYGSDTYGFLHRTFLEYFCALEIVRTLTFEQLRDDIFGQQWQDETWHEVLRLICALIDIKYSSQLIEFLIQRRQYKIEYDSEFDIRYDSAEFNFHKDCVIHILLAADCITEISDSVLIESVKRKLLQSIRRIAIMTPNSYADAKVCKLISLSISKVWGGNKQVFDWLSKSIRSPHGPYTSFIAVNSIAYGWQDFPETIVLLKEALKDKYCDNTQHAAVEALASKYKHDLEVPHLLKDKIVNDESLFVRLSSLWNLAAAYFNDLGTFEFLREIASNPKYEGEHEEYIDSDSIRLTAAETIVEYYSIYPETIKFLHDRATNDSNEQLREWAKQQLDNL
jgi:hypothetical protein